jgi:exonuclease III
LKKQFARTPYAVSFKASETTFVLVTLHILYQEEGGIGARKDELNGIARWMADWAKRESSWEHNLIALGDFNIDRRGDKLWQAFTSTGLTVPPALNDAPRSVFDKKGEAELNHYYDQIAWFENARGVPKLSMSCVKAGYIDFLPHVYTDTPLDKKAISYRVSDHYPLWVEFSLPPCD